MSASDVWSRGFPAMAMALVVGAILMSACKRESATRVAIDSTAYRPECPVDSVLYQNENKAYLSTRVLSVPGNKTLVHEYNDCQRFVRIGASDHGYEPLIAIFARQNLNAEIERMLQLAANGVSARAVSIALILSWDGPYNHLGIERLFNCLYMWADIEGADTARNAMMVPVGADDQRCLTDITPIPMPTNAKRLNVFLRRPTNPTYSVGDFPEVARWDLDPNARKQYIAIGCRDAWCDIAGDASLNASPDRDNPALSASQRRLLRIKPWYDEQFLADIDVNGNLIRSDVIGTFYPDAALGGYQDSHFAHTWRTAAYSYLSAPFPLYVTKLNFAQGAPDHPNRIELCHGTLAECGIPTAEQPKSPDCSLASVDPWWARITPASGQVKYRCVILRPHPSGFSAMRGMVRWRWSLKDERGWISCPSGCCEVVGET